MGWQDVNYVCVLHNVYGVLDGMYHCTMPGTIHNCKQQWKQLYKQFHNNLTVRE